MATHAVSTYAYSTGIDLVEVGEDRLWELVRNVGVHLVVQRPGRGSSINVETGTRAKVVAIVFTLNANATLIRSVKVCAFMQEVSHEGLCLGTEPQYHACLHHVGRNLSRSNFHQYMSNQKARSATVLCWSLLGEGGTD